MFSRITETHLTTFLTFAFVLNLEKSFVKMLQCTINGYECDNYFLNLRQELLFEGLTEFNERAVPTNFFG